MKGGIFIITKTKEFHSLLTDIVFKYLFGYSKNIRYTEYLLELIFNLEPGSLKDKIEIINSFNLEKTSFNERGLEVDVKVKMPNGVCVNLEAYSSFSFTSKLKSTMYIGHMFSTQLNVGDDINDAVPHIQINFIKSKNAKSRVYEILSNDEDHEPFIKDYFYIVVLNIDESNHKWYNNTKLLKVIKLMNAKSIEEELEIIKGDDILYSIEHDKQDFLQSEWASKFFNNIDFYKSEANAIIREKDEALQEKDEVIEDQAEALENTVKLLHKQKTPIKAIAKATKLDINKIEEIINNN